MPMTMNNSYRWFIVLAVMLSTVMEILDTTIVSVSLPHMMGSLSADRDQISWVLTSYIVAAGVFMPLTGFFVNRLGSKRLLLINVFGFMIASALCGIATNLTEIVLFRLLQGIFGASLVPLSQFILRDSFSLQEQPKIMAIWGVGVMAAPILGPTIGGYITDLLNWRWIFYINVPICILDLFLIFKFIKDSPLKNETIDWLGMTLMIVSIGALQLFLDRGEVDGWFSSSTIRWLCLIFIVTFIWFIKHSWNRKDAVINLRLFTNKTFAFGTLIMAFFAAAVLGSLTLFPQMLEMLFGYTSNITGIVMAPRGIMSAVSMIICSRLMMRGLDGRWFIAFGLALASFSTWLLSQITLDASMKDIVILGMLQGFGIGCFFMPLSTIVYSTLPTQSMAEAAGLFSFGRSIGNAIGISLLITYLDRDTQANWHILGQHIQSANPNFIHWLNVQHLTLQDPKTMGLINNMISSQANFIAYMHVYKISAVVLLLAFFMVGALHTPKGKISLPQGAH